VKTIVKFSHSRSVRTLALVAALVAIVLLAGSMGSLSLGPGAPFPGGLELADRAGGAAGPAAGAAPAMSLLRGLFAAAFLVLTGLFLLRLVRLINLQQLLRLGLAVAVVLFVAALLPRITPGEAPGTSRAVDAVATPMVFNYPVEPIGRPPDLLIQLAVVLAATALVAAILLIGRRRPTADEIQQALLDQARSALQALHGGLELPNVILRCYRQMSLVLQQELGIERDAAMTVREFEAALEKRGFPRQPVHQLTSLFESARYSRELPGPEQEADAVACLEALVEFCRSSSEGQG